MLYGNNSNKKTKLRWNPIDLIRLHCSSNVPAYFMPGSRIIHIELPPNSCLVIAIDLPCFRFADALNISNKKNQILKKICTLFKQRVFESNQYDNLSPPLFLPCFEYGNLSLSWCDHDSRVSKNFHTFLPEGKLRQAQCDINKLQLCLY